jgi:hypothetical protein
MENNIYIIATTAINRSDLHNIVIPKWKNWLLGCGGKIKWFINIDILEYLNDSYENTKRNFENLLNDSRIELKIMEQQYDKFLGACKNLSENIKNYVEIRKLNKNTLKIVWLEDDWDLIEEPPSFSELEKYCGSMSHLNLSGIKNNYIWALAPSILSYDFWLSIFYEAWKNQRIDLCPEKSIGNYYQTKYCSHENTPNIILLREAQNKELVKDVIFKNTKILYLNQENSDITTLGDTASLSPIFIKLFPNIAFDIGIEYMRSKNITKQFVKKNRNQIVIEYKYKLD